LLETVASMSKRRFTAGLSFALLLTIVTPTTPARAAGPAGGAGPAGAPDGTGLASERGRLRGELDHVNAEIDALKKANRGVGDDYRLRARLADAEALARRLIEIEARLGLRAPAGRPAPLPIAAPTDGPADLDAKADILADQSRRLRGAADALGRRVAEIKGRQELRRRAADLDRDPFAPLEGSKRRLVTVAASGAGNAPSASGDHPILSPTGGGPQVSVSSPPPPASSPGTPVVSATTATLSVELRDLLDPATVADFHRLEGTKSPTGSVLALERAVAALRARADALDAQARAMRSSAGQK
jgi:hypothetical protein